MLVYGEYYGRVYEVYNKQYYISKLIAVIMVLFASDMLEESDLDSLTQELRPAQNKWRSLGEDFNFNSGFLDMIHGKYSYPDACLREMLREQLKETYGPTTWRNIVDALRSPDVRESQLADELEAKYCPSELTTNNTLLYFSGSTTIHFKY